MERWIGSIEQRGRCIRMCPTYRAPLASENKEDVEFNQPLEFDLGITDLDGDDVQVTIKTAPESGELAILEDNRFTFVTKEISKDISQATYPIEPYVSFLDNILITNSLLSKFSNYDVKTINIGDYMNGFENYERLISDHFPVFLSF